MTDEYENTEIKPSKRRGLGRGLDALFEDGESSYNENVISDKIPGSTQRKFVGIEQLEPNPLQPRRIFDENALSELAESIEKHGMLQPLIVRPKEGYPDIYQIIAGERRWRAAQKARVHEVAVLVTEHDDETVLEIALVENLQREDLNPLEEARGYRQLIDQHGHTQEDVAKAIGKSRSHVANMVRLLNLPESVQKMLEKGELSSGHARSLVTADDPEAMAEEIIFRGLNVRQAEELAGKASEKSSSKTRPPKKQKDPDTRALEEEVSLALGMKVTIHMKSKGAGKLDVEFKNLDQLDEILHRISHYPGSRQNG